MGKWLKISLGLLLILTSFGAIPAGLSMIMDSSGRGLGMDTKILENSFFETFFIPGIFLFSINGIVSLLFGILVLFNFKYSDKLGIFCGVFLMIWIIIQVNSVGLNHFLQPTFFAVGLFEVYLGCKLSIIKRKKRISYYFRN